MIKGFFCKYIFMHKWKWHVKEGVAVLFCSKCRIVHDICYEKDLVRR